MSDQPIYISYCGHADSHTNQTGVYILIWLQVKFHYKQRQKTALLDYPELFPSQMNNVNKHK